MRGGGGGGGGEARKHFSSRHPRPNSQDLSPQPSSLKSFPQICAKMATVTGSDVMALAARAEKLSIGSVKANVGELKRRIAELDKLHETLKQQEEDFQYLLDTALVWDGEFRKVGRFSQGIPQMRGTKEICGKIRASMSPNSDFDKTVKILQREKAPCISRLTELFDKLKARFGERSPNAKVSEEIRQIIGEIVGTLSAVLNFFYDQP